MASDRAIELRCIACHSQFIQSNPLDPAEVCPECAAMPRARRQVRCTPPRDRGRLSTRTQKDRMREEERSDG